MTTLYTNTYTEGRMKEQHTTPEWMKSERYAYCDQMSKADFSLLRRFFGKR